MTAGNDGHVLLALSHTQLSQSCPWTFSVKFDVQFILPYSALSWITIWSSIEIKSSEIKLITQWTKIPTVGLDWSHWRIQDVWGGGSTPLDWNCFSSWIYREFSRFSNAFLCLNLLGIFSDPDRSALIRRNSNRVVKNTAWNIYIFSVKLCNS